MWGRFSDFGRFYTSRSAEQFLLLGVVVSIVFLGLLYTTSCVEGVLTINNGVGLYQHYGLYFVLIGDSVLLFVTRKYFDVIYASKAKCMSVITGLYGAERTKAELDICFKTKMMFVFFIFSLTGLAFIVSNITLQLTGNTVSHWHSDVFDSPAHPTSFLINKIFMTYSWVFILPWCAYSSIITSIFIGNMSHIIEDDANIQYDLMDPDDAGGFASFFYAKLYYNIGLSIVYLEITILVLTFSSRNTEHIFGYVAATVLLAFGNLFSFRRIDSVVEAKRVDAINRSNEMIYKGDALRLDVVKFHIEMFGRKSLGRRVFRSISSLKAAVMLVPPVVKLFITVAS